MPCADIYGINAATDSNGIAEGDPRPVASHGTHCAGIAAAVTNNAVGVAGVAGPANPVRIMACNCFHPSEGDVTAFFADILQCIM